MNTETTPKQMTSAVSGPHLSSLVPFDAIREPGCYVCTWNGHLVRVPHDGICSGGGPAVSFVGPEPLFVVKISDDPFIRLTKARLIACNLDVDVSF